MRALLMFNPNATTTDDKVRDVIASALASEVKLEVQATKQRGQAIHIAAGAVHEGFDVVFALGGDGTANEALQALAGTPVRLGIIPGGSTNVFARVLGLPNDAVAATAVLLEKLRHDETTTINLARAGDRYFAVNAGFGFDAAVVRRVERRYRLKRAVRQLSFVYCAVREWFSGDHRRHPPVDIELPGQSPRSGFAVTIVGNTTPYSYLRSRPMQVTPDASFERGLDLLALHRVRTATLLRIVFQVFTSGAHVRHRQVEYWHDLGAFTLRSATPQPLHVDGDYAGEHSEVTFRATTDALTVLA